MGAAIEPDFKSAEFLKQHVESILAFYEPTVRSKDGGFHQCFLDDGTVYDDSIRHLVSSTRFVFNYAHAYQQTGREHYRQWATEGLDFLRKVHLQPAGHYAWIMNRDRVADGRAMAYGHAFVMLAAASCTQCTVVDATDMIASVWAFTERYFWDRDYEAYADERDDTLQVLSPYRGQNANMHLCEALLAAYEATGEGRYLDRAKLLARRFAFRLADASGGLIWEHYDVHWQVDMHYNIDKPDDLFKPWGFQPGHQVEWSKLLLQIYAHDKDPAWVEKATALYQQAMTRGWDDRYGGLVYGFAPDGTFCDAHKYFWVQAEAIASAYRLYITHDDERYLNDYIRLWRYCWNTLIDHDKGGWFRLRHRDGSAFDDLKSPPGKTDYHTMGACWDVLSQISR